MFPLTHVLVAQNLLSSSDHQVILGGIFPDLGNAIGLNRIITHEMGTGFYGFCRDNYPEYLNFARAIITHGSQPHGLDYYADECYQGEEKGYCFQRARPFCGKVVAACDIPQEMGLWKAHNFIEMAYELIAVERFPHLSDLVPEMLDDKYIIAKCSDLLGHYFNIDTSKVGTIISSMPTFFCLLDVTPQNLAAKYARQLEIRHQIKGADVAAMSKIIEEVKESVALEFGDFISSSIELISDLLRVYPSRDAFIKK
ncbi:MAG: hypothetical protein PHT78_00110 [Desulfitobacteriaceae bacterium]|nr:hypothetical protein [Desulfitobacteriaceae bacterium]MDD4751648.1 hypothetical protein [Desulfitobacteriaceae bacterium]